MKLNKVVAVIILFNPDLFNLKKSLFALLKQVDSIYLIDNTIDNRRNIDFFAEFKNFDFEYYSLGLNEGVSRAQNIGISHAIDNNFEHVLIMDQDSVPTDGMVFQLKEDLFFLKKQGYKIGVIGPTPINIQTQKAYSSRIKKNAPFSELANHIVQVDQLISSGSLIECETFKHVGFMDEALFIDGVDHEWCWRAKSKGYQCAMSQKAKLHHMLGEGDKKILGVRIAITSPFRVFYQYRNYLYLCKKNYVPFYWKFNNAIKYLIKMFYYPLFVSPRKLYLVNILKGVKEGLMYSNK
jgi:rhamnosyltransferase